MNNFNNKDFVLTIQSVSVSGKEVLIKDSVCSAWEEINLFVDYLIASGYSKEVIIKEFKEKVEEIRKGGFYD